MRAWACLGVLGGAVGLLGACGGRSEGVRFRSTNALDRTQAIKQAAERRDPEAVPGIVGLLDDADAGVRMYAEQALWRLCGEDFGYRYYQPAEERQAAIERWEEALRAGTVRVLARERPLSERPAERDLGRRSADAAAGEGA